MRFFIRHSSAIFFMFRFIVWPLFLSPAVNAAFKNLPFEHWGLLLAAGITLAIIATFYLLKLGDYIEEYTADAQLGNSFAEALEERISVGDSAWTANDLATLLVGERAEQEVWNRHFRWIKHSVLNGYVDGTPLNENGHPVRETVIRLKDLAEFFRRRDWKKLAKAPEGFYDKRA